MFNTLKWMPFPDREVDQKALQMYKTTHCNAPDYLTTSFPFTSEIHTRLLRSSSTYQLYTPRASHELFRHLHFQGLLSGILSLTHQMLNSSKVYIWGGIENLPHNCIMQCYTDYRQYIMYTKNVNSVSWPYLYILSDVVHV